MKFRNIFMILVFAATMFPANSRIVADISSVQVEGSTFRARGVKLTNGNNPAKAWVENLDGTGKTFLPITVNKKRTAVRITMPFVDEDTKMNLFISGGNVPENDPQKKFIVVIDDPTIDTSTFSDVPTVSGSDNSSLGTGQIGPQGNPGEAGPQGLPGYIYGGNKDVDTLPDYQEAYNMAAQGRQIKTVYYIQGGSQTAGELELGNSNAVSLFDSNRKTDDILGLIKGNSEIGQRITLIVDDFFFLALSDSLTNDDDRTRPRREPVVGSIVAPNFFEGPIPLFAQTARTIEVNPYQIVPIFPGMVLELVYDGVQWRLINLPFYYGLEWID